MNDNYTIKVRLTNFLVLMCGTALLICLFTLVFAVTYNYRYQQTIEQMIVFNEYCDTLDSMKNNLDSYAQTEEESYYLQALQAKGDLIEITDMFNNMKGKPDALRELRDINEMTNYLFGCQEIFHTYMQEYLNGRKRTNIEVRDSYEIICAVYNAITERYLPVNQKTLHSIMQSYQTMKNKAELFLLFFLLLFLGICLMMVWQIRHISRSISAPISVLTQKAKQVREGNLSTVGDLAVPKDSDKELCELVNVFDDMTMQVKKQIETLEENARVRHELEESRFKELQMQINPHFLFNTLNMIAEKAYFENAEETVDLLENAAKMFRFSLDFSGKSIPLSREIEEVGTYVFMQEQRFGARITFLFELDEIFHDMIVPALILQPLVENAIIHGIGMRTENARITIKTLYNKEKKIGQIVVKDNGIGMSMEKLNTVRSEIENYSGQSVKIGLGNVYLRLKIFYKGKADMRVESNLGYGTSIILTLPYEKGECNVSSDYCRG